MTIRLVIDVENSVTHLDNRRIDNRPHNKNNDLVSIGILNVDTGEEDYVAVYHNEKAHSEDRRAEVKNKIQSADILIGHNIK